MSKTVDVKELVKRLRDGDCLDIGVAADALEAMEGEVAGLKEAHAAELKLCDEELVRVNKQWSDMCKRAEAAESERDRLKAALEPFAKLSTDRERQDPPEGTMRVRVVTAPEIEAARKALGGDA